MSALKHVAARSGLFRAGLLLVPLAVLAVACGKKDEPAGGAPGGAPPPTQVGVVTVEPQSVALQIELPGRVEALRVAQVRARVNGVVQKRLFTEGTEVKAGQALYQIDPAPYQAALQTAQAQLARAEANLAVTTAQAERYKPLAEARAVSQQEYQNTVAAQKQAQADVAAGKAAVTTARLSVGYAAVTAPISGRIGRSLVSEGQLVSAGEATQLAVIQQTDKVYVNFTQPANEVLRMRKALAAGQLVSADRNNKAGAASVRVVLEDGSELPRPGKLLFSDLTVDGTSGQITLRAEVPNPDTLVLPGQYVRVRLVQAEVPQGILLPQQAVTRSNQGDSVLVIGAENKPETRKVKVSSAQQGKWLVTGGLKRGEQVIVDGVQHLQPGAPVKPVPAGTGASAPASGASAPPAASASGQ